MTMEDKILEKLDELQKDMTIVKVHSAGVEQHLKNLNGSVARHEGSINTLFSKTEKNSVGSAKVSGVVALLVTLIVLLIRNIM